MIIQTEQQEEEQLQQYRRRNMHLRRQLRQKDHRIMQLFDFIDQASSRLTASTPHSHLHSPTPQPHRSVKITYSPLKPSYSESKKGKGLAPDRNHDSGNIFKQLSFSLMGREKGQQLQLPALEQRGKLELYPREDSILENPESRPKMVKIPLDRLKPLNSKQVKKRFLMKLQRREGSQLME